MQCPQCGRDTEADEFCSHCGAHLPSGDRGLDATRTHAYITHPNEPVLHLSVITTLFPHLNRRRSQQARWLLLASALIVMLIGLSRFVPLAIVLAALLLPGLYLAYFIFTEIYADVPLPILGATFASGLVLGVGLSEIAYRMILSQRLIGFGLRPSYVLLTGVLVPLISQALMLVGPLILYFRMPRFNEPLDGLVFGAASGFGFAAAQSVVYSWLLIVGPFHQRGQGLSWVLPVIWIALLVPLLDAATTGIICCAIWLHRDKPADHQEQGLERPEVAVPVALLGQIVPSLGYDVLGGQGQALIWYGVAVASMLLLLRMQIHRGLLGRAQSFGGAGPMRCPYCHHQVAADAFCSHCGLSLRSQARRGRPSSDSTAEPEGTNG